MQWRKRTSVNDLGITHGNAWGDWLAQGAKTPLDYVDTVYFAISAKLMAEMAEATGRKDEARAYREQFQRTKTAFIRKYLKNDGGINVPTQTAHALALFADLVPSQTRVKTGKRLAEMISSNGNHMSTGFLGTRPLLPVLSSVGQHDLATFLLQSREFPSWGYEIDQGATTIWERWDSYTKEDGFGRHNAAMNSFSHYSFGAVCEWMFRTLAGIGSESPGYGRIIIRPTAPSPGSNAQHEPIDWVKASYDSIRGRIVSNWKVEGDRFLLDVTIPANTTATVFVPARDADSVTESDRPLSDATGVDVLRTEDGSVVLRVESGQYRFIGKGGIKPAEVAIETSKPADLSVNPENIDLRGAKQLVHWDFRRSEDRRKWPTRHNLQLESRGEQVFLASVGADPQLVTELPQPLTGSLAIELRAKPGKGATAQFFWASTGGGFNARGQNQRQLNPTDQFESYLFRIGDDQPLQKLRFDPFQNEGEMEIESISIYQLQP
jgi:alpha-L-rhamnosidase